MSVRVGIDTGGTFTDLVAVDTASGKWYRAKVPSIPRDPLKAILEALAAAQVDLAQVEFLILGTTVGTNALLQRKGARVAYLATEGFEDVPFIQRGNRKFHYDLHWIKPRPFLDRRHCLGVPERLDYRGSVVEPLDLVRLRRLERQLQHLVTAESIEALAINLLFAYLNPQHELQLERWTRERFPQLSVSVSHKVAPVWREFERGITTIADAYLKPLLSRFIAEIDAGLSERGYRGSWGLMRSNGGTRLARHAASEPVQLLLSGLAGGVVGGKHFGLPVARDLITLDMGGTSCDLAVIIGGEQRYADQFDVEFGLPLTFPTIELSTIGAGGGSIAWVDRGGFLRVGPQSAGAEPGPACYGLGGHEPTVTDANLVLGRLDPAYFLAGAVPLYPERSRTAIAALASELGQTADEMALAIIQITNENMVNAIRVRTVEIGIDPRRFSLVAFGGAGALHASAIARRLGIEEVLIPPHPGLCSAFGVLIADLRSDQICTVSLRSDTVRAEQLNALVQRLSRAAIEELRAEQFRGQPRLSARLALRYSGQNYEHEVGLPSTTIDVGVLQSAFRAFADLHESFYGYKLGGEVLEIVNVIITAVGPSLLSVPSLGGESRAGQIRSRVVRFTVGSIQTRICDRAALPSGERVEGPAIIEEPDSTTLLEPGDRCSVLGDGTLKIAVAKELS